MRDFKTQRMSEEDQILEAKKEQARLLKHIVNKIFKKNQISTIVFLAFTNFSGQR
jgi:hypothetical protein